MLQNGKGILLVFLIYFYFLQFSQFTLLHLLEERVEGELRVKAVLGAMALCGIAGSFIAVLIRRRGPCWRVYVPAFLACGLVALVAPFAAGPVAFTLLAGGMGLAMGLLTVTAAGMLPLIMPGPRLGLSVGMGTGLGYAMSNLPVLFSSPAELRSITCGLVLLAGSVAFIPWSRNPPGPDTKTQKPRQGPGHKLSWASIVLGFMLLVWLDSAVFYIIQESRQLKAMSWTGEQHLYLNALIHLLAALLAGHALDRGFRLVLLPLAWLALAAGAAGLQYLGMETFTLVYVIGVSIYSCALVYFPSLRAEAPGDLSSFKRAAVVYAVAGWVGSALGIGMAENLSAVPVAFLIISGLLLIPVVGFTRQKS